MNVCMSAWVGEGVDGGKTKGGVRCGRGEGRKDQHMQVCMCGWRRGGGEESRRGKAVGGCVLTKPAELSVCVDEG